MCSEWVGIRHFIRSPTAKVAAVLTFCCGVKLRIKWLAWFFGVLLMLLCTIVLAVCHMRAWSHTSKQKNAKSDWTFFSISFVKAPSIFVTVISSDYYCAKQFPSCQMHTLLIGIRYLLALSLPWNLLDGSGEMAATTCSSVLLYCRVRVWFNARRTSWMILVLLSVLLILGQLLAALQSQ